MVGAWGGECARVKEVCAFVGDARGQVAKRKRDEHHEEGDEDKRGCERDAVVANVGDELEARARAAHGSGCHGLVESDEERTVTGGQGRGKYECISV